MGKKDNDQEPLSNFQDIAKTGRTDGTEVHIDGKKLGGKLKDLFLKGDKEIDITGASLAGEFCNYSYEILKGKCAGDSVSRSGSNIYHSDLKKAFWKLFVHLAIVCEEIDHTKVKNIDELETIDFDNLLDHGDPIYKKGSLEDIVTRFRVSSFRLKGSGENASVVLVGTKTLSTGDQVKLTTPDVKWDGDYAFINELRAVVDDLKYEVEEYMNGKAAPQLVQQEIFPDELVDENA